MRPLSRNVSSAIINAAEWLRAQETWVVRGQVADVSDKLQNATAIAYDLSLGKPVREMGIKVRRDILFILAYLPADIRIGFLIEMAETQPDALESLINGVYDPGAEPALYNIVATIGSLARRGLLSDIFTEERMNIIDKVIKQAEEHPIIKERVRQ